MAQITDISGRLDRRKIKIAARGAEERRRHRRVRLSIPGRALSTSQGEFACRLVDVSPGGVRVAAPAELKRGERVVMLFDGLGRMEGEVVRAGKGGFAARLATTQRKRDRLADAITWRFNMERMGLKEDRTAPRKPGRGRATLSLRDGVIIQADVTDVSVTGAAFACLERPRIGEPVRVGGMTGRVARWLDTGFAVQFDPPDTPRQGQTASAPD
ncbi:PilZ domain-containing protein [Alkalicaulis satelles]|uniref:PilZ domain-containing protein n=1 Tax=Alkalicaulis satelles TaxID=2609175 RepID=A0A5M6ZBX4_9PROT|nr:PilZ domain-containing protein [Alkalicaulis satelles]KAA5802199.1 PilZ domain-containing protein [Alkalicaulis satelles]